MGLTTGNLTARLVKWLIFSVVLALLPIAFNAIHVLTRSGDPTLENLLGGGELLLVAAAISAASIGYLVPGGKDRPVRRIVAAGGAVIVLVMTSYYFADIAAAPVSPPLDTSVITLLSGLFFLFAVLAGAGCVALEEV
ncbi:hypothetical protein JYT20_00040 [Rhodothermus sp. AH-315-K08]|nr:hypothetical protein [Rhodothermus sp. AH-315-K08]